MEGVDYSGGRKAVEVDDGGRFALQFARHVARLLSHGMVKCGLTWNPPGSRTSGRPTNSWVQKLISYCRCKNSGHWVGAAEKQEWTMRRG